MSIVTVKTSSRSAKAATPSSTKLTSPKPKNKTRTRRNRKRVANRLYLSDCAKDYLKCVSDPFGLLLTSKLPCIPDLEVAPSFKFSTLYKGVFTIGTTGNGFVAISPRAFGSDSLISCFTGPTYAGLGFTNSGTGVLQSSHNLFPFTAALTRPTRVVGAGLRVRYIGTELQRSGQCVPALALLPGDTLFNLDLATCLQKSDTEAYPCDRKWHGCAWRPMVPDASAYSVTPFPISSSANLDMGVIVSGSPGETYEFQFVIYYEMVNGTAANGNPGPLSGVSASHSDIEGMSVIRDWLGHASASKVGTAFYTEAINYIESNAATIGRTMFTLSAAAANGYMRNRIEL